jgi:hypothetical protein
VDELLAELNIEKPPDLRQDSEDDEAAAEEGKELRGTGRRRED